MAELVTEDATLHVEVDGSGDPIMVLAHGLTNSCRELSRLTPFVPGTKVRFCFRGHGHSSSPEHGYLFADFARDVEAVADAYGANVALGTSLGAGAIANLVARKPTRFQKLIFLLPAGLDLPFQYKDRMLRRRSSPSPSAWPPTCSTRGWRTSIAACWRTSTSWEFLGPSVR